MAGGAARGALPGLHKTKMWGMTGEKIINKIFSFGPAGN